MEKLIEFAKKYYVKELFFIFAACSVMFFLFYGKMDAYLVDVGRETYIPWQMLKGKLLYKDIFNVYGPLGYQINAVLYAIFGVNLKTLYFAGFTNTILILFSVFYIAKLFVDRTTALCCSGLALFVCAFSHGFFNFIFVYSYNAVYALSGFLLSLLFALLYVKEKNTKNLVLAFLFAGFSFANKIEDLPYFCLLFLMLPFLLKKDWKKYIYAACAFFAFPLVSFGVLFIQGVGIQDFINSFDLIKKLVDAPSTTYFYYNYGIYFNILSVKETFVSLIKLLFVAAFPFTILYLINFFAHKYLNKSFFKHLAGFASLVCVIYFVIKNLKFILSFYVELFCWAGMACIVILSVFAGYLAFLILYRKLDFNQISVKNKMFIFLTLSALCVSFKGLFSVIITCYGTFTLTVLFLPIVIFAVKYVSEIFPSDLVNVRFAWVKAVQWLCVAGMITCFSLNFMKIVVQKAYTLNTSQGRITIRDVYPAQDKLIDYISKNTPEDAKIVVLPEGAIINFLTQRDSDNRYYYLIPGNVEIFTQAKIVKDFEKNPPDYFLLSNLIYGVYNKGDFCSYAHDVCEFIGQNYKPEISVTGDINMTLYKKK